MQIFDAICYAIVSLFVIWAAFVIVGVFRDIVRERKKKKKVLDNGNQTGEQSNQ